MAQSVSSRGSHSSQQSSSSRSLHKDRADADIPLDVLISYLVAAKRSLSSIHLVHRATTCLSQARSTVESTAALVARTKYLRRSIASQLKILRGIQFEIEGAAQSVKAEIQSVLTDLEYTDQKLQQNITLLKATRIEQGFKDAQHNINPEGHVLQKDTLHDFVDDEPVEELKANIQLAINDIEAAETRIDDSIRVLEEDLQTINTSLDIDQTITSSLNSDTGPLSITKSLKGLESHAHEMAVSLESLVRHFDLCVTAIKHTEGAGALVAKTMNAEDLPDGVDVNDLTAPTHEQELAPEERAEMLTVLSNDAAELEEVVLELQDRAVEMESSLDALMRWRNRHRSCHAEVQTAFDLLEKLSARLPSYVAEINTFRSTWLDVSTRVSEGRDALSDLTDVYVRFLDAYDSLIVEAARRRSVKKQMLKIVQDAHSRLERIYEEDLNERELFRGERGESLPMDIWSGVADLPSRWAIVRVDGTGHEGDTSRGEESIPELPRRTVEEALRRLRKKVEGEMVATHSQSRSHSGNRSRADSQA